MPVPPGISARPRWPSWLGELRLAVPLAYKRTKLRGVAMAMDDGHESTTDFSPYVTESTNLPELTFKAVALGVLMAVVLGAANA